MMDDVMRSIRPARPGIRSIVFSMPFMTLSRKTSTFQSVSCSCERKGGGVRFGERGERRGGGRQERRAERRTCCGLIWLGSPPWPLRMSSMALLVPSPSWPGSCLSRPSRPLSELAGSDRALLTALLRSEMDASDRWSPASPRSEWIKSDPPNVPVTSGGTFEPSGALMRALAPTCGKTCV